MQSESSDFSRYLETALLNGQKPASTEISQDVIVGNETWRIYSISLEHSKSFQSGSLQEWINFRTNSEGVVVQIVGDSASPFDSGGTKIAEEKLKAFFAKLGCDFKVLWGLTGQRGPDGGKDVNQIVNDWIDEDPESRSKIAFANIVDADTIRALKESACTFPKKEASIRNFIAVCGGAKFGDDIPISDSLTDHLIVMEGGYQSLTQALNVLEKGGVVSILKGLRSREKSANFSAAATLERIGEFCSNIVILYVINIASCKRTIYICMHVHSISSPKLFRRRKDP